MSALFFRNSNAKSPVASYFLLLSLEIQNTFAQSPWMYLILMSIISKADRSHVVAEGRFKCEWERRLLAFSPSSSSRRQKIERVTIVNSHMWSHFNFIFLIARSEWLSLLSHVCEAIKFFFREFLTTLFCSQAHYHPYQMCVSVQKSEKFISRLIKKCAHSR